MRLSDDVSNGINKESENILIQKILEGDKNLFELLVHQNNQKLYRVLHSYLHNPEDIKDVLQNTYIKAYIKLNQFHNDASFSTWLIKIGINEALKYLQKQKNKNKIIRYKDFEDEPIISNTQVFYTNPEKRAIEHESSTLLENAVNQLPPKLKVVYILREIEGMNVAGASACLNLTESTIKVRLHRAKEMLRNDFSNLHQKSALYKLEDEHCHSIRKKVMHEVHKV